MIRKAVSIFILILFPILGFSQELEMIYEKTSKAMGGQEAWEKTTTIFAEGSWYFPEGEDISFIYKILNPDLARFDFFYEDELHTVSKYGRRGWINDPKKILPDYEKYDDAEKVAARSSFLYVNNLIDYKKKGLEIKFEGSVLINKKEVWLVRLVGFPDKEELYFISMEDYRPFIKQSYYTKKGRNSVVNYNIQEYRRAKGLLLPMKILVTSEHLNFTQNFTSYVINSSMEKSEFKDPNEPDFTTNTLDLTKEEAQNYLNTNIPITRRMGIEVETLTTNEVKLKAPIALNINHHQSAFGGSVDSLFLTAGWSYVRLIVNHIEPLPLIVGSKANTTFKRPITQDFAASLVIPSKREVRKFLKEYERNGKASITLEATIKDDGKTYAIFKGKYVVIKDD